MLLGACSAISSAVRSGDPRVSYDHRHTETLPQFQSMDLLWVESLPCSVVDGPEPGVRGLEIPQGEMNEGLVRSLQESIQK